MGAMFLSNLLHRKLPPRFHPGCRPVSVIVCARNEEKGIYGTIGSIARQEYDGRVTILCVDNGSTDGTLAEMRRAAADFSRPGRVIRLYGCCEPGKARALNEGLRHVRDEYFVTVDADTRLETSALAAIVGRIAATGAGCVAGNLVSAGARTWVQKMQFWDYFVSIAAIKRYQGSYGATLVAQGAFSVYETAAVRAAGGWTDGAGEEVTLPVVMYHRVCEQEDADRYTVSAAGLEKDLEALLAAGYTPVRLSQVLDYARSGGPLPRRPVLLVFDDGDASFAREAMPVLKKYDVPAVVSVIGDAAAGAQGRAGEHLTWSQLAALEETGLVELQSHSASLHTYARPGVKRLPGGSEQDHATLLAADAARMQAMADEAGAALLPAFAYPYGALDANAEKALKAAGMQATMTSEEHSNTLTRSPECLFALGRFERTGFMTTAQLLAKLK